MASHRLCVSVAVSHIRSARARSFTIPFYETNGSDKICMHQLEQDISEWFQSVDCCATAKWMEEVILLLRCRPYAPNVSPQSTLVHNHPQCCTHHSIFIRFVIARVPIVVSWIHRTDNVMLLGYNTSLTGDREQHSVRQLGNEHANRECETRKTIIIFMCKISHRGIFYLFIYKTQWSNGEDDTRANWQRN